MKVFRRSRCLILLCSVVAVHLVVLFAMGYGAPESLQSRLNLNFVDLGRLIHTLGNKDASFDSKVTKLFSTRLSKDNKHDAAQLFLLDFANNEFQNEIRLPEYLVDDTVQSPGVQQFDPRFTLGLWLDLLADSVEKYSKPDDMHISQFHWADWTDLSELDSYLWNPDKSSCLDYNMASRNKHRNERLELFDINTYCFNDADIDAILEGKLDIVMDESLLPYVKRLKDQPMSSGWHVFKNSGRSKTAFKLIQSKAYLNDFMPPPSNITLLLPDDQAVSIPVNQDINGRVKLIDSDITSNYVAKFRQHNRIELQTSDDIILNAHKRLDDFRASYFAKFEHAPVQLAYEKPLSPEMFLDESKTIVAQLTGDLNSWDQRYKDSLEYSLSTNDPPKYFSEAKIVKREKNSHLGAHYDWRFFSGLINYTDRQPPVLFGLIKAWLALTNRYNIHTWIAHGSLLSWYWDGISFPWDNDIDVQMPIGELHKLARYHNQSLVVDLDNGAPGNEPRYGRYFLDCGLFLSYRVKGNGHNNIDARFIDVDTGLYIDITALALSDTPTNKRYNFDLPKDLRPSKKSSATDLERNTHLQAYNCRNNHFARLEELSPLRLTIVEGQPAYIPKDFTKILKNEYSSGLEKQKYQGYTFMPKLRMWVLTRAIENYLETKGRGHEMKKHNNDIPIKEFTDDDYVNLLLEQEDLFVDYMLTKNITAFHEREMDHLLADKSTKSLLFNEETNKLRPEFPPLRHDHFIYASDREEYSFERTAKQKVKDKQIAEALHNEKLIQASVEPAPVEPEAPKEPESDNRKDRVVSDMALLDDSDTIDDPDSLPVLEVEQQTNEQLSDSTRNRKQHNQ